MIVSSESWGLSSTRIHGTHVPVEEPSTASTAELGTVLLFLHTEGELALRGVTVRRANAPTHRVLRQPGNLHGAIGLFGCLKSHFFGSGASCRLYSREMNCIARSLCPVISLRRPEAMAMTDASSRSFGGSVG